MIIEFIAAFSAGFALFGAALILNLLIGRRMPRWAYPVAFAGGMIGFGAWSEYSWAARSVPENSPFVVVEAQESRVWYRPWSWVVPQTTLLIVLDRRFTRIHPDQPDLIQTRIVRLERFMPESGFLAVLNCAGSQVAPLVQGVELMADGTLEGADWAALPETDPMLVGACALREEMSHDRGSRD